MKLSDAVKLKAAAEKDALFFLKVRNQKTVRAASFQTAVIEKDGHFQWYARALADKKTALFVIYKGKTAAGTLRLNLIEADKAEIHLALLDSMRGKGVGTAAVSAAVKMATIHKKWNVKQILACIKRENKASIRCFQKAGFQGCGTARVGGEKCLRFIFSYLNILTVIDAGRVSGLGHLMRQSVLARELAARGHNITFAVRHLLRDRQGLMNFFMSMNYSNIRWQTNSLKVKALLREGCFDAVIWDALNFDGFSWKKNIRNRGLPIFAIGNYPSVPGWIRFCVNPYTQTRPVSGRTKVQSSPAYCILSDEFALARSALKERRFGPAHQSKLLILPGGGNTNGMIFKIVQALKDIPASVRVTIVCGAFFTELEKLKSECGQLKCRTIIRQNVSAAEIVRLMTENDLGLVSYGRSIDEARVLGLPVLILSSSPLNALGAKHAQKQGGVKYLGDFERLQASQLSGMILRVLNSPAQRRLLSRAAMKAVDGSGCVRTADWILKELAVL